MDNQTENVSEWEKIKSYDCKLYTEISIHNQTPAELYKFRDCRHYENLGTILNNKLDWNQNCKNLIQKVNKRMLFLRKILSFGATQSDKVHLWVVYCRSVLEQSAVLWQGGLTQENRDNLERTQHFFCKANFEGKHRQLWNTFISTKLDLTWQEKRHTFFKMGKEMPIQWKNCKNVSTQQEDQPV